MGVKPTSSAGRQTVAKTRPLRPFAAARRRLFAPRHTDPPSARKRRVPGFRHVTTGRLTIRRQDPQSDGPKLRPRGCSPSVARAVLGRIAVVKLCRRHRMSPGPGTGLLHPCNSLRRAAPTTGLSRGLSSLKERLFAGISLAPGPVAGEYAPPRRKRVTSDSEHQRLRVTELQERRERSPGPTTWVGRRASVHERQAGHGRVTTGRAHCSVDRVFSHVRYCNRPRRSP